MLIDLCEINGLCGVGARGWAFGWYNVTSLDPLGRGDWKVKGRTVVRRKIKSPPLCYARPCVTRSLMKKSVIKSVRMAPDVWALAEAHGKAARVSNNEAVSRLVVAGSAALKAVAA